ncbi:MAG: TusE/DsrC/DsvC family sulfur relay protein [Thermoanaerobaculia bacterium]
MPRSTGHPPTILLEAAQSEWTPSLAECVARVYGIDALTESHWRVISECREEWAVTGRSPGPEEVATLSHLSVAELESLFPPGQLSLLWILAGVAPPSNPPTAFAEPTLALTAELPANSGLNGNTTGAAVAPPSKPVLEAVASKKGGGY